MRNKINFITGETYTLSELFSGSRRIIIPDLQRDYCWGDSAMIKNSKSKVELVSKFIENLKNQFEIANENSLNLGLIYGYEEPETHIHLCDGQQRMTTLYLLIGVLNKLSKNNRYKSLLISEFELSDDKEPYLQYSIRESSLYFLSDLVCNYFITADENNSDLKIEDINTASNPWYFNYYDNDPSIQSMIQAIKTIESSLADYSKFTEFGDYLVSNLTFMYYDMETRTKGEETFVVINTTGEDLTLSENLKPILIGDLPSKSKDEKEEQKSRSKEWEIRENWFWQNRNKDKEDTSDEASYYFYVSYCQIALEQESRTKDDKSYNIIPRDEFIGKNIERNLEDIHCYFKSLERFFELCGEDDRISKVLNTIEVGDIDFNWLRKVELHISLPILVYLRKFEDCNPDMLYRFIRRLRKNYYDNVRHINGTDIRNEFVNWQNIIKIIKAAKNEEEVLNCSEIEIDNEYHKKWYTEDELLKRINQICLEKGIENTLDTDSWEDNEELYGDLTPLWKYNNALELDNFESIQKLYDNFELLRGCMLEETGKLHPVLSNYIRLYRVLLGYPKIEHPYKVAWKVESVWFSWKNVKDSTYFKPLYCDKYCELFVCEEDDELLFKVKSNILNLIEKRQLFHIDEKNFTVNRHLKLWLILKAIIAEKENQLLSYWNGGDKNLGLASFYDYSFNKLNTNLPFSIANSICGYAARSRSKLVDYAKEKNWISNNLDTPLNVDIIDYETFANRSEIEIPESKIEELEQYLKALIDDFMKTNSVTK